MSHKDKLYLVKTLVIPTLTYPCVPLNACSRADFGKLQVVLNRALKFAFNIRYPVTPKSKDLHTRAKLEPINIILFNRAKNLWYKLETGIAGDVDTFNMISEIDIINHNRNFPSSLERARKEVPPPIFTIKDTTKNHIKIYYQDFP